MHADDRDRFVHAIHELASAVREAHRAGAALDIARITRQQFARLAIDPDAYARALSDDPSLALLERSALNEAVADATDPGPYDGISREAPAGQPGALSRTAPANVGPRS